MLAPALCGSGVETDAYVGSLRIYSLAYQGVKETVGPGRLPSTVLGPSAAVLC